MNLVESLIPCFNSMIVRLKAQSAQGKDCNTCRFQFYDSPIKRAFVAHSTNAVKKVSIL